MKKNGKFQQKTLKDQIMSKFEIFQGKDSQYYFRLKADNGQTILSSEGYKAKSGAKNGIASVQKNAADPARFVRKDGDSYSFSLKAGNHEVIGRSQSYKSSSARENGIESVMKNAPKASIEDAE